MEVSTKHCVIAGYLIGFLFTAIAAKAIRRISLLDGNRDVLFVLALAVGMIILFAPVLLMAVSKK